jgi:hypothetical protein
MGFIDTFAPILGLSIAYFLLFTPGRPLANAERIKSTKGRQ